MTANTVVHQSVFNFLSNYLDVRKLPQFHAGQCQVARGGGGGRGRPAPAQRQAGVQPQEEQRRRHGHRPWGGQVGCSENFR